MNSLRLVAIITLLFSSSPLLAERIDNLAANHYPAIALETAANGFLRLDVKQAPLSEVMRTIHRETGIEMHHSILAAAPMTKRCVGKIDSLLECLLGAEVNVIYRYAETVGVESTPQPAEVWVLGSTYGHPRADTEPHATLGCNGKTIQDQAGNASEESPLKNLSLDEAGTVSLLELAKSKDAWQRAQAVTRLGLEGPADDANVTGMLEAALSDQDAAVRAQAISGLARREGYQADAILREALQDSNVEVRLMSVDSAGNDRSVLEAALGDDDETVRQLATMKLEQLSTSESLE